MLRLGWKSTYSFCIRCVWMRPKQHQPTLPRTPLPLPHPLPPSLPQPLLPPPHGVRQQPVSVTAIAFQPRPVVIQFILPRSSRQKSFQNLLNLNQIWIWIIIFRLIFYQTEFLLLHINRKSVIAIQIWLNLKKIQREIFLYVAALSWEGRHLCMWCVHNSWQAFQFSFLRHAFTPVYIENL